MKLRIRENTVRVRMVKSEVAAIGRGEPVEQTTEFSVDSKLIARVQPAESVQQVSATFGDGLLCIYLPMNQARRWATSDEVAIAADQPIAGDRVLKILIEKDFECLHSEDEKIPDAYPNPAG